MTRMEMAILFDATKCIGCRACQVACKQWNDLEGETIYNPGNYDNPVDLSPNTWMKIKMKEVERSPKVSWLFLFWSCFHCTSAECENNCPVEAIFYTKEGFVIVDSDKCTVCGICVEKCPFGVIRLGEKAAVKCNACISRIDYGEVPACVKTCPAQALTIGTRDFLIKEGKKQVQKLKNEGYFNANLFGEKEQGGLHILSVLDDYPTVYGLPEIS